ncbi:Alpha/Beta hydrolase protein [Entophlyctis helioformis]|nr:Alpha/Beta hydrolase protein [Entophlyctis helioformis]
MDSSCSRRGRMPTQGVSWTTCSSRCGTGVKSDKAFGRYNGFVDMDRIAVTGWSYGGYLSLMALCHYPSIFKMSLAGAPVTNWELYDTAYTERYMGLLEANRAGYTRGSVLEYAHIFPDAENRLLLVHGLIDENVHFRNTEDLVTGLARHSKPHRVQVYPLRADTVCVPATSLSISRP